MFGITEEEILATGDSFQLSQSEDGVSLRSLQPIPELINDGVDTITILEKGPNRYLLQYAGYLSGYIETTRDGMEELGMTLFADQPAIPSWVLDTEKAESPWWIPESYEPPAPLECEQCHEATSVTAILIPLSEGTPGYVCRDCWYPRE